MIIERFPELQKLTPEDRALLCMELGGIVYLDEPITDPDIIAELNRRMDEYRKNPSTGRPAFEVLDELRANYVEPRRQ
jgi:hypothetical protein